MLKSATTGRRRPHFSATADPELLKYVDDYVAHHEGVDRSSVIDEALRLWKARMIELEVEKQYSKPDGVDPEERAAWLAVARASFVKHFSNQRA
jgi:hypothetical protein